MQEDKKTEDNKVINYENLQVNVTGNKNFSSERNLSKTSEAENVSETNKQKENITEKKNTISGAIFAMTSLSIGTGCLTFTKKVIEFGFVWFGVTLILGGIATYWTLSGLIRSARKKGDSEYSSIVRKELGLFPAILVDVMTCLYSWGLIITYEIIMNSLIGRVIYVFFKNKDTYPTFDNYENEEWDTIKIKIIVLGSINALLIILCLFS
jgi:amino acid permease